MDKGLRTAHASWFHGYSMLLAQTKLFERQGSARWRETSYSLSSQSRQQAMARMQCPMTGDWCHCLLVTCFGHML